MSSGNFLSKGGRVRQFGVTAAATAAAAGLAVAGVTLASQAGAAAKSATGGHAMAPAATGYTFKTLDNPKDLTFNQLLGINQAGLIAGYFGIGSSAHPNKGYLLRPPYSTSDYKNENFPGSAQTQVTGLNDVGNTVGFWVNGAGANFGFFTTKSGQFYSVNFPGVPNSSPPMNQLLGINDHSMAVGFYVNSKGNSRGYEYSIHTHKFTRIVQPGSNGTVNAPSLTAAAINNNGTVAGFYVNGKGVTDSFVKRGSTFISFAYPGATMTQAFGINDSGEVVGAYTVKSGKTYGFTWVEGHGFQVVNDPNGIGSTLINGVNDRGELVGFYTDSAGNTDGFLAQPHS